MFVEREDLNQGIEKNWGRSPVGEMCLLLVERILSIKPEAASALSYSEPSRLDRSGSRYA